MLTTSLPTLDRNRSERIPGLEPCVIRFGPPDSPQPHPNELTLGSTSTGRLSIVYDSEKSLPAVAFDAKCSVIFDGWLHNRKTLLQWMDDDRIEPDADDARIILTAYLQHGEEIFSRIHGMFQLIILDGSKDVMLSVRDRFGIFPLFFSDTGSEFLICTSIDALLRHPRVSKKINRVAAAEHLSNRWLKLDETYYEKIRRVPPSHAFRRQNGDSRMFQYWDPFSSGIPDNWAGEEALEQFDQIFEQAVARRMQAGQTAIFLSGGLDSVSIASVAADYSRRRGETSPLALSLIFPHPECNEKEIQENVARQLGLEKYLLPFESVYRPEGLLHTALEVGHDWPSPPLTPWKAGYYQLSQDAHAKGYRWILSGDGGDEWLTVHPNYLADLMRSFNIPEFYSVLRSFMRSHDLQKLSMLRFLLWESGFRQLLRSYAAKTAPDMIHARRKRRIRELTRPWVSSDPELRGQINVRLDEFIDESMRNPVPAKGYGYYFAGFSNSVIRTISSLAMEESFEIGRRTGVWLMKPYYDAELVDLLLRITPSMLQRGGREKGMVRETVARRFPGLKFERQRKVTALGFLKSLLKDEGPKAWKRLGGARALESLGIIDHKAAEAAISRSFSSSDLRTVCVIWELLNLETWVRPRV